MNQLLPRRFSVRGVPAVVVVCALASMTAPGANKTLTLLSAGSTFIYPILSKWQTEYARVHPGVQISYEPLGSGHGIARTLAGTVDFGASDGPVSDLEMQHSQKKLVQLPVVLGGVVPSYNLPGVSRELRFTPEALAGIFLGKITRWNDSELTRANPNAHLPDHELMVVFRTDSSGTTYVWTDYLSKVSPEWNRRVGRGTSVKFPLGQGAEYNEGVQKFIREQPYSIGYLQSTYAIQGHLQSGLVRNSTGKFVRGDSAGITAAAAATATTMPDDFRVSITNSSDEDAYPISSFTWILVPDHIEDQAKREAIVGFLKWVLKDGQQYARPLDYAPLPGDVARRVLRGVDRIR